jgi:NAD-dependent deacetylase sirtuin 4
MFGESISATVKEAAESAIDDASRLLILGSSLATYSAWRLVKRAHENGMPIGILNIGGVRGEEQFFKNTSEVNTGAEAVRAAESIEKVLPAVVEGLRLSK